MSECNCKYQSTVNNNVTGFCMTSWIENLSVSFFILIRWKSAFYRRNNKGLVSVWAEGMKRRCSCHTVTAAGAGQTNSLCKVNEWYHQDCVTRSNILYRTRGHTNSFARSAHILSIHPYVKGPSVSKRAYKNSKEAHRIRPQDFMVSGLFSAALDMERTLKHTTMFDVPRLDSNGIAQY